MSPKVLRKQPNSHMCFVCGLDNPFGLQARFYEIEGKELVGLFTPSVEHQGYPGRLHGGIASTILDETVGRAVLIDHEDSWWVTTDLSLRYRKPVLLDGPIRVVGRITGNRGKIYEGSGEVLLADGTLAVSATGRYLIQRIEEITENDNFAGEMWNVVSESTDPHSIPLN